jgi:hypothetical protein
MAKRFVMRAGSPARDLAGLVKYPDLNAQGMIHSINGHSRGERAFRSLPPPCLRDATTVITALLKVGAAIVNRGADSK